MTHTALHSFLTAKVTAHIQASGDILPFQIYTVTYTGNGMYCVSNDLSFFDLVYLGFNLLSTLYKAYDG